MSEEENEPRERRPGRVRSEPGEIEMDLARQAELNEAAAKMRAEDTQRLSENEAANYASGHAIIEQEEAEEAERFHDDEPEA